MSKQLKQNTPFGGEAVAIARAIARGNLLGGKLAAACARVDQEISIIEAVARLGYLEERHIAQSTGIEVGLTAMLDGLVQRKLLKVIDVVGWDRKLYWLTADGIRSTSGIVLPGFGTLLMAEMNAKAIREFAHVGVGDPVSTNHLVTCANVVTRLDSRYNGTVLGERTFRLAEKIFRENKVLDENARIGTFSNGHSPDAIVIAPNGEVTAIEVECSPHDPREDEAACGALKRSPHIAAAFYIAYGKGTYRDVKRRLDRNEVLEKASAEVSAFDCQPGKVPALAQMRPAGVTRRRRRPAQA